MGNQEVFTASRPSSHGGFTKRYYRCRSKHLAELERRETEGLDLWTGEPLTGADRGRWEELRREAARRVASAGFSVRPNSRPRQNTRPDLAVLD
jgi:hypothetical protein